MTRVLHRKKKVVGRRPFFFPFRNDDVSQLSFDFHMRIASFRLVVARRRSSSVVCVARPLPTTNSPLSEETDSRQGIVPPVFRRFPSPSSEPFHSSLSLSFPFAPSSFGNVVPVSFDPVSVLSNRPNPFPKTDFRFRPQTTDLVFESSVQVRFSTRFCQKGSNFCPIGFPYRISLETWAISRFRKGCFRVVFASFSIISLSQLFVGGIAYAIVFARLISLLIFSFEIIAYTQ